MGNRVTLSVVIVNHNTKRLLEQCLRSLYETIGGLAVEIFVVDNASSDDSVEMIESNFPQVKLIANSEGLGFARAANLALARGKGDYFLIAHPDIEFEPGTVHKMLSYLQTHDRVGIVGANLVYPDGSFNSCGITRHSIRQELIEFLHNSLRSMINASPRLQEQFRRVRAPYYWDHRSVKESEQIWNACMMVRRDVLEMIGAFYDGFYIWFADTDLCYRAKNAGWQLYYLPDAKITHYEKQSGQYIDNDLVVYKVKSMLVQDAVNKDRYMLLKRHSSPLFLWFKRGLDVTFLAITVIKLALLRIFAPARYRSVVGLTR